MFSRSGTPLGNEFRVNQYTTGEQSAPSVAYSESGEFIVAWNGLGEGDDVSSGIFARRLSVSGQPISDEFRVNDYTPGSQRSPSVSATLDGSFVIAWHGEVQDGSDAGLGVYAKLFSPGSVSSTPEFRVNSYTTSDQRSPSVGMDASGNFIVAWQSDGQDHVGFFGNGVYAKRYSKTASSVGTEFRVNTFTTWDQFAPSVAMNASGEFAISWTGSDGQDGSDSGIFAKSFSKSGEPASNEFQANSLAQGFQVESAIGVDEWGRITVVWQSGSAPSHGNEIIARRFLPDGTPLGGSFGVSETNGEREYPSIAIAPNGDFAISWDSLGQDGNETGVLARSFRASKPETLGTNRGNRFHLDSNQSYLWDGPVVDTINVFGSAGDKPLVGDWNGDGYSDIGIWRNGSFYLDADGNGAWNGSIADRSFRFGTSIDSPISGDWNGDGKDEVGVWRAGKFYLDLDGSNSWNSTLDGVFSFGAATDTPLIGDWNADGTDDLGVWRSGRFYLDLNANRTWNSGVDGIFTFGNPTDAPLIGDWNGDGIDDLGVWRSGKFYLDFNGSRTWNPGIDKLIGFGSATDTPLVGYWRPKQPSVPTASMLAIVGDGREKSKRTGLRSTITEFSRGL